MNNKDIIKSSDKTIAKYSSDIIKRGLSLAVSINQIDLDFDSKTYLEKAEKLFKEKEYEKALELLNKIIEIEPNYQDCTFWELRARTLAELKYYQEALDSCEKAIALQPDDAWYWSDKAEILIKLERYEEALLPCEKAIALQPDDAWHWCRKEDILTKLERY